jgi:UDP-N-acetylglucosamine diphosphorylase/glucosamine-1-phosphate N-acetyltransferase
MPDPSALSLPVVLAHGDVADLGPLARLRSAADIRTGALTLRDRLKIAGFSRVLDAPEPALETAAADADGEVIVVSSRAQLAPAALAELEPGEAVREPGTGEAVAARLPAGEAPRFAETDSSWREADGPCLLRRPWDVIRFRDEMLAIDLSLLLRSADRWARERPAGSTLIGEQRLAIDPSADVMPTTVFDVQKGPVVIDANALVRPRAIICGPAYIGPGSTVLDGALVKANTAIGPVCKVAGEVGGTIFQGYANKAHDGHLGDSWIGRWANLGAGTTNSNLLNTYGEVATRRHSSAPRERTGLTFLGAIVGDHVKTAIGTRIFTGSVIDVGAMIASSSPPAQTLPPFAWVTDSGVSSFRIDKFLEVARAAMSRRGMELSADEETALRELHREATA